MQTKNRLVVVFLAWVGSLHKRYTRTQGYPFSNNCWWLFCQFFCCLLTVPPTTRILPANSFDGLDSCKWKCKAFAKPEMDSSAQNNNATIKELKHEYYFAEEPFSRIFNTFFFSSNAMVFAKRTIKIREYLVFFASLSLSLNHLVDWKPKICYNCAIYLVIEDNEI